MALREKNPNIGIRSHLPSADQEWVVRKPKLRQKGASQESKQLFDFDDKENVPPSSSRGQKSSDSGHCLAHMGEGKGYLTEKWQKEASMSSSAQVLAPPPAIQRAHLKHEDLRFQNRSRSSMTQSGNQGSLEAYKSDGSTFGGLYSDHDAAVEDLVSAYESRLHLGSQGRNAPKPTDQFSRSPYQVELQPLGHTRQSSSGLFAASGGCDTIQSLYQSRDSSGVFRPPSPLDFSAAVRNNMDSNPVIQPDLPALPPSTMNDDPTPQPAKGPHTQSIRNLTNSKEDGSAEYAEFLLRQMLCDFHEGITDTPPDGGCFNSVVHAYACRGDAPKAEAVLALMWHEFYRGNLPPDKRIFTTVMYAWQRSEKKVEAPDACEHLLRQMHQLHDTGVAPACGPDTFTYTCILHCWANSERADAANRAELLFRAMLQRYKQGDDNLKPDTICYSNLINVFIGCGRKYDDAERILWEMVDAYLGGLESAAPTVRSFNTLLAVWSKSSTPEAPERVQHILQRWKELKMQNKLEASPDEYSYALLLKAWTKANRMDSIDKLLQSFQWIKDLFDAGEETACPDVIKYTTVIGALNKAGQVDRAFVLLGELINKYNEYKLERYKPDARCFHIIITAFSRCKGNISAGKKAESLLRRMWVLFKSSPGSDVRPTQWTYNTVIFCFQNAGDPKRAERLLKEMNHLAESGSIDRGADIRTYKAVIHAWRNSTEQTKHIRIRALQAEARALFNQQI